MYMAMARLTCAIVALHKSRGKSTGYAINEVCTFHVGDMRAWKWKWNLRNENGVQRKNGGWHHRGSQKKIKNLGKWTCHPLLWFFLYPNIKLVLLRFPTSIPTLLSMTPLLILFRSHSNANTKPTTWKLKHETWNNPISHIHPIFSITHRKEFLSVWFVVDYKAIHSLTDHSTILYTSVWVCVCDSCKKMTNLFLSLIV